MTVVIDVEDEAWNAIPDLEELARSAIAAGLAAEGVAAGGHELSLVFTSDSAMAEINRDWRGQDKPTNVLSFPAAPERGADPGAPHMLGDIAIAFETVQREAKAEQKSFAHHLAHLTIHGVLHLAGHDHENDAEAETMEALERTILASLGIADPYADIG